MPTLGIVTVTALKGEAYSECKVSKKEGKAIYENFNANKQIVANSTNQTQAPENIHPTNPDINTDWQDAYLRNAPMYNLNASISGGGEYSTFNTSLGYFDQQGIMEFSGFPQIRNL